MTRPNSHDFSSYSSHCVECGLPFTHQHMECRPSTDDSPEGIAALRDAIARKEWSGGVPYG